MLADLVKAGKLPPVEQRLPAEPVVVKPLRKVGKYGGTAYGPSMTHNNANDMQTINCTGLFSFNNDLSQFTPLVASSWKLSSDYKSATITLRKGLKWSDGTTFDANEMMWFFENMVFDKTYTPVTPAWCQQGGQPMKVSKVDDYTVQFDFAVPSPAFYLLQKTSPPIIPWRPRKFFETIHPKFNPNADAQAKAESYQTWQAKFTKYAQSLTNWNYGDMMPEVAVLDPWVTTKLTPNQQLYDRNPYYLAVDTEGNQLPYIDKWQVETYQDLENYNTRTISGDLTLSGHDLLIANYPLLKQNVQKGNYTLLMANSEWGSNVALGFNQCHPDPVIAEIFHDKRFRQAMSVAINRKSINELVFLGLGAARQATMNSSVSFFKQAWADTYAQYDTKLANSLLDQMGLDKKGADGIRLMKDGRPLAFSLEYIAEQAAAKESCDLVVKDWQAVGVKAAAQLRDKTFLQTRLNAAQHDCSGWIIDRALERSFWCEGWGGSKLGPGGSSILTYAKPWQDWLNSGGKTGVEPPQDAKDLATLFNKWQTFAFGTPEYTAAGIAVGDKIADMLYVIGVIGEGPAPVVITNKLENVFSDDVLSGKAKFWFGAAEWYLLPTHAEQWFFKA